MIAEIWKVLRLLSRARLWLYFFNALEASLGLHNHISEFMRGDRWDHQLGWVALTGGNGNEVYNNWRNVRLSKYYKERRTQMLRRWAENIRNAGCVSGDFW